MERSHPETEDCQQQAARNNEQGVGAPPPAPVVDVFGGN